MLLRSTYTRVLGLVQLGLLGVAASSCGAGNQPADLVKPDAPTADQAMGEVASGPTCGNVEKSVEPLVVDWKSGTRTDLEVAMKRGVVVMAYGCEGMKLLERCELSGSYEFAAVTPKEDVIQIENKAELWANLPLSVGSLETELEGSATIDLAIALVGRRGSLRSAAAVPELKGDCAGATHFVRAAHVGAFVMTRGERGKVRAAAELFSIGAGGGSETKRRIENRDGDLTECRRADAKASEPPGSCGATVRLMLEPIAQKLDPDAAASPRSAPPKVENPCPEGWKLTEGKCASSADESAARLCEVRDEAGCDEQCRRGSAESCYRAANVKKDPAARTALLEKACTAGVGLACSALGDQLMRTKQSAGLALHEKACALGEAWVCWNTGQWYIDGRGVPKDATKGALMVDRACSLGYPYACATYGSLLIAGVGVKADVERGLAMYQRLCDNGQGYFCHQLGSMYATDRKALRDIRLPVPAEVKRDVAKGIRVWEQGCAVGSLWSCTLAGRHYVKGDGVPKDTGRARQLFERACGDMGSRQLDGCEELGRMYEQGLIGAKDMNKAVDYYAQSCPSESCTRIAKLLATGKDGVAKDEARALSLYAERCKPGAWGSGDSKQMCYDFAELLEKTDADRAKALYADHCARMGTDWVGGTRVSAHETRGGRSVLAQSCVKLGKLDPAALVSTMKEACVERGTLCKELEQQDRAVALAAYQAACEKKKLRCADAERLRK